MPAQADCHSEFDRGGWENQGQITESCGGKNFSHRRERKADALGEKKKGEIREGERTKVEAAERTWLCKERRLKAVACRKYADLVITLLVGEQEKGRDEIYSSI